MDPLETLAIHVFDLSLADIVNLLVLGISAVIVWRNRPRRVWLRERVRCLNGAGISRAEALRWCYHLESVSNQTPAQEVAWLSATLFPRTSKALTFDGQPEFLSVIANSYREHIRRMDQGHLFGDARAPLLNEDVARCRGVLSILESVPPRFASAGDAMDEVRPGVTLTWMGYKDENSMGGPGEAVDVAITYRRDRLYFLGNPSNTPQPGQSYDKLPDADSVREEVVEAFKSRRLYDGVLPRVMGWDYRRDPASGRILLHLSLAEVTYSAVTVDSYPTKYTDSEPRAVSGNSARLLTLSGLVLTSDNKLVFTQRSNQTDSYRGLKGASVNGNLELADRLGLTADIDDLGLPDVRRALVRECREELGLDVDPSRVIVTGLVRFSHPEERGTFLLTGVLPVDLTFAEVSRRRSFADPIEGRWEVEGSYAALPVPADSAGVDESIGWLRDSHDLTVHATANGLAAIAYLLRRPDLVFHRPTPSHKLGLWMRLISSFGSAK